MASEERGLKIDQGSSSWCQDPDHVGKTTSASVAVAVASGSGSDGAYYDIEEGTSCASQRTTRPTVDECFRGVPEDELTDLPLDVYNMFFLSEVGSQGFFYSIVIFVIKISLYTLLIIDLAKNKQFPTGDRRASTIVKVTQLFLMPVAILMQEELIASFFIISRLKYSPGIRRRNPGALKWKYFVALLARLVDGCTFLFVNICVMLLQVNDVLQIFLNFAALMFLQSVDNIALQVCVEGYWTRSLQKIAKDVVVMKLAYRHHYVHNCMQASFVIVAWAALLAIWLSVHAW